MKLRKLIHVFVAGAVLLGGGTVQAGDALRVGVEGAYPPFSWKESDGTLKGFDIDFAHEVCKRLGRECVLVEQEWDGMIPALLANKFDLIIASMSITEKRMKSIDFSSPYRFSTGQIVGPKKKKMNLFNSNGEPISNNFNGIKVGLERATTYSDWFETVLPGADVKLYDNNESLYLDLQNGRVDVIMTNPMKAYLKFLSKSEGSRFEFKSPVIDEEKFFGIGVGIGMRKGQADLKNKLNNALKYLINTGELETYAKKIFPFKLHQDSWGS